jgi:hypothetical protein
MVAAQLAFYEVGVGFAVLAALEAYGVFMQRHALKTSASASEP